MGAKIGFVVLLGFILCGCGKSDSPPASSGGSAPAAASSDAPNKPAGGVISGKITFADGKPIDTPGAAFNIGIYGVSTAGEKVSYSPAVKPDGTYSQKVVPGSYRFGVLNNIEVPLGSETVQLPLEAVGNNWNKDRDAADGIVQDYVWKVTGLKPYGRENGADPNNHTHWYGVTIGMRMDGYRNDISKPTEPPPEGTKFIFSLKPLGTSLDGHDVAPMTIERTYKKTLLTDNYDLNDLPPAPYELSGTAKLPDGTTKLLLLRGREGYPKYFPTVNLKLEKDSTMGNAWIVNCVFVIE